MRILRGVVFFIGLICFVAGAAGMLWVVETRGAQGVGSANNVDLVKITPAASIRSLDIRTDVGTIVFSPGTGDDVTAHFTGAASEAAADQWSLTADTKPDGTWVVAATSHARFRSGLDFVLLIKSLVSGSFAAPSQLEITLPPKVYESIAVRTNTGSIRLGDVQAGTLDARADTGAVALNSFHGGTLKLHSDTGAIDFHGVSATGSITADTNTGRVEGAVSELSSPVSLRTNTGAVSLDLPAGASALFDLSTSVGPIDINGAANISYTEKRKHHLAGKLGAAAQQVQLRTDTGSITLNVQ